MQVTAVPASRVAVPQVLTRQDFGLTDVFTIPPWGGGQGGGTSRWERVLSATLDNRSGEPPSKLRRGLICAGQIVGGFGGAVLGAAATGHMGITAAALATGTLVGVGVGLLLSIPTLRLSVPVATGVGASLAAGGSWPVATMAGCAGWVVGGVLGNAVANLIERK